VEVVVVFPETDDQRNLIEVGPEAPHEPAQPAPGSEHMARLRAFWQRAREQAAGLTGPTLSEEVLAHAAQLLELHSDAALRSLDAIQLACALVPPSRIIVFFANDQRLGTVAQANGLLLG